MCVYVLDRVFKDSKGALCKVN